MKEANRSRRKRRKGTEGKLRLTKAEAQAYVRRWAAVNRAEIEELRRMSVEEKFWRMVALSEPVMGLPRTGKELAEEAEVRERWRRLREVSGLK